MKRIWHPSLNRHIVLGGCRLPKHPVGIQLKDFIHAKTAYPSAPATRDWTPAAATVIADLLGNDQYGDCVEAEEGHFLGIETGNANTLVAYSDAEVLAMYTALTGFNPRDPNTDQGTDPIACLNWFLKNPYKDGSTNAGYAMVDATNVDEVKFAINTFGNLKSWFGIPDSIANSLPNASGFVWDVSAGSPDPNNGHCIGQGGYTDQGVTCVTWGMTGTITWAALAAWFQSGLAVRITKDWISKNTGQTPSGLNLSALMTAFNTYLGGNLVVPPSPTPPPPPVTPPAPGSVVTLAQAEAWAAAGIASQGHFLMTQAQATKAAQTGLQAAWPSSAS